MEQRFSMHGPIRSITSLASTILPILPYATGQASSRASPSESRRLSDLPLELTIPLPPSRTGSPHGERDEEPRESRFDTEHTPLEDLGGIPEVGNIATGDTDGGHESPKFPGSRSSVPVSLGYLVSLDALEKQHALQAKHLRHRLSHLQHSCGLERRLRRIYAFTYRAMAAHFRTVNRVDFLDHYDASQEILNAVSQGSDSTGESQMDQGSSDPGNIIGLSNWMELLPSVHRDSILYFLDRIRSDTRYAADCLSRLPSDELVALTSSHQCAINPGSVLPGHSNLKARRYGKDTGPGPKPIWLQKFGQNDPIFLLLYCVFDDSLGPCTWEYRQRIEMWATICARILERGKRGSDEVLTTALDAFANLDEWTLRPRLETYLAKALRDGSFLLETSTDQAVDFGEPVETHNAKAAVSASNFFNTAVQELLELLAGHLPQTIPPGLQDLVRSVLAKIENPKIRNRAEIFMLSKWFFCSYISNMLLYPENYGMLMTYHVGDTTRTVILKEIVVRLQKQVFDVSSPWKYSLVSSHCQALVEKIFGVFKTVSKEPPGMESRRWSTPSENSRDAAFLILSPQDVATLIKTLHLQSPSSRDSDDSIFSGNVSKASSLAESSTLTSGSTEFGSGVPSSTAPSLSGTSMTSATVLSEALPQDTPLYSSGDPSYSQVTATQGVPGIQKQAESELISHLPESCRMLCALTENDPGSYTISCQSNWASLSVSAGEHGPSIHLASSQHLNWEANVDQGQRGYSIAMNPDPCRKLEDAVCKALDLYNISPELQYRLGLIEQNGLDDNGYQDAMGLIFQTAMANCQSNLHFQEAHFWWTSIQTLQTFKTRDGSEEAYNSLLTNIIKRKQSALEANTRVARESEIQVCTLEQSMRQQKIALDAIQGQSKALRLKMWYECDVKHSATYEDASAVARALRAMTDGKRSKKTSSVSSWARQRLRTAPGQDKSTAQVLEALVAPKDYGGLAKLADQQVDLTTRWLTRNSIENFCKGEERVHRFCQEIQRCVNKLAGVNMVESPVLWSSDLFKFEKSKFDVSRGNTTSLPWAGGHKFDRQSPWVDTMVQAPPSPVSPINPSAPLPGFDLPNPKRLNEFWDTSKPSIPRFESKNRYGIRNSFAATDPARWFPSRSYGAFLGVTPQSSSHLSVDTRSLNATDHSEARKRFASNVREAVTSLLLSDLGHQLWNNGTETDIWLNRSDSHREPGGHTSTRALQPQSEPQFPASSPARSDALSDTTITVLSYLGTEHHSTPLGDKLLPDATTSNTQGSGQLDPRPADPPFPFSNAYATILEKLSCSQDPHTKLDLLYELELLAFSSLDDIQRSPMQAPSVTAALCDASPLTNQVSARVTVPRTKATCLEEVVANCTERRAGTLQYMTALSPPRPAASLRTMFQPPECKLTSTDEIVEALLSIFRNDALRPPTLYRDLQLIAAHIPSSILDRTAKGKAFWDAGLAALALKDERISAIIARATRITTYHISATKDDLQIFTDAYAPDLVNTTLTDAANLWTIAAKEGNPVAARELALFYLTHPELVPRVTMPLSKAKDVFRSVGTGSTEKGVGTGGLDPYTFAVVFHWMEVAASGGDKDARDFLRGTGDLSGSR